jgi:predicted ester cyclase
MSSHRLIKLSLVTLAVGVPMVAGAGAFAGTMPTTEPAAETGASAMSIDETQEAVDAYFAALQARDDIAPYFSDDVVLEIVDVGQRVEGRDAVVGAIVELHEQTFDARPEQTGAVIGEGTAALELVFVGTHTGDFAGIPASGTEVAVPYAAFYDLADGQITALRIHGFATGLVAALTAEAPATSEPPTS